MNLYRHKSPFYLLIVWVLLKPIDVFLKHKQFTTARTIRESVSDCTVIAITGSVGKTTTKSLIEHLLKDHEAMATPAFVNSELGVARWLINTLGSKNIPKILIVEMGAYRIGEISLLCSIVKPTISVVTFIGKQHVGLFGSKEALWKAKSEIVTSLPENGHTFLNGDNEGCLLMKDIAPGPVTIVGTEDGDLQATDIEETASGIQFKINHTQISVPLHGTHNVTNVLLAIAVANHLKIPLETCAQKLRSYQAPEQTFQVKTRNECSILDDRHNSSLESFQAAIQWARSQPYDNKILLCSGIIELGDYHHRTHVALGEQCKGVFSRIICTNKKTAADLAIGFGQPVETSKQHIDIIPPGSLLVCEGRVSESIINQILPPL